MADQRLEVGADSAADPATDVEHAVCRALRRQLEGAHEVGDVEQLVAVPAVAEDVHAPSFADPAEEDPEHTEPLGADERGGPENERGRRRREPGSLRCELRAPVGLAGPLLGGFADRWRLDPVHDGGRHEHAAPHTRLTGELGKPRCG